MINKCKVCGRTTEKGISICGLCFQKPMVIVYHNGNGQITKDTIKIETLTIEDIENYIAEVESDDDFVCIVPLEFITNKI